jgi:O-antigen ligase
VHQTTDAVGIAEAGAWRGIFNGKNALGGLIAGPAFAFLLIYGRHAFETWTLRGLALAASLACLLMARSGAGYIVAGILAIMGSFLSLAATQPIKVRISMLALAGAVALIPIAFGEDIAGMVLELLNRDASLSGRTTIWTYVLQLMEGHWTLGYGYYSGFVLLGAKMDEANPGLNFGSTHSGYLDLLVSFGVVGVCVGVGYLLWLSVIAFGKFMSWKTAIANPAITFSLCVIAFAALNNIVESTILAPNCIVPMLLSISAGMLSRETIIESAASARNQLNDPRIQGQLTKPALGRGVGH